MKNFTGPLQKMKIYTNVDLVCYFKLISNITVVFWQHKQVIIRWLDDYISVLAKMSLAPFRFCSIHLTFTMIVNNLVILEKSIILLIYGRLSTCNENL